MSRLAEVIAADATLVLTGALATPWWMRNARRRPFGPPVRGSCPGYRRGRPLDRAWSVVIRNRTGPALQRNALLCEDCVEELRDQA